jgi:internalin A
MFAGDVGRRVITSFAMRGRLILLRACPAIHWLRDSLLGQEGAMKKLQVRIRHLPVVLAVLASCGLGTATAADPDDKDSAKPLSPETVKAWRDAGGQVGWMKDVPAKFGTYKFGEPWREKGEEGAIPAFRFPEKSAGGVLAKLPDPGTAFGLDFHCGFYAGVKLKELAELKHLQSLCIGGVQGEAYADLKDLAGMTNLRGLYLFYLRVTDDQLKHLVGLKSLKALDLSHTLVTDRGLKELASLKDLQWLNLYGTEVTQAGVAELQKALPKCKILSNDD